MQKQIVFGQKDLMQFGIIYNSNNYKGINASKRISSNLIIQVCMMKMRIIMIINHQKYL